jgi:hypothetical protein
LEKNVDKTGAEALMLEEIQEDLLLENYQHFQRTRQSNRDKEESSGKTALYTRAQFKGAAQKCRGCRKYGVKVANCPDKKEKDGSRITSGNKQWNLQESVSNAMKSATRHRVALIKGRMHNEGSGPWKLPW